MATSAGSCALACAGIPFFILLPLHNCSLFQVAVRKPFNALQDCAFSHTHSDQRQVARWLHFLPPHRLLTYTHSLDNFLMQIFLFIIISIFLNKHINVLTRTNTHKHAHAWMYIFWSLMKQDFPPVIATVSMETEHLDTGSHSVYNVLLWAAASSVPPPSPPPPTPPLPSLAPRLINLSPPPPILANSAQMPSELRRGDAARRKLKSGAP